MSEEQIGIMFDEYIGSFADENRESWKDKEKP